MKRAMWYELEAIRLTIQQMNLSIVAASVKQNGGNTDELLATTGRLEAQSEDYANKALRGTDND